MIIKNYTPSRLSDTPILDLQIIEDVKDVFVHGNLFESGFIGHLEEHGITSVYCSDIQSAPTVKRFCRHIDFTHNGVRCRLIVTNHAYVCNDRGQTVEKVSC